MIRRTGFGVQILRFGASRLGCRTSQPMPPRSCLVAQCRNTCRLILHPPQIPKPVYGVYALIPKQGLITLRPKVCCIYSMTLWVHGPLISRLCTTRPQRGIARSVCFVDIHCLLQRQLRKQQELHEVPLLPQSFRGSIRVLQGF